MLPMRLISNIRAHADCKWGGRKKYSMQTTKKKAKVTVFI